MYRCFGNGSLQVFILYTCTKCHKDVIALTCVSKDNVSECGPVVEGETLG